MSSRPQFTVAQPVHWTGVGLHTGEECGATVRPSESGGVIFLRNGVEIPAVVERVSATARCTTLSGSGVSVSTVEHLLAALAALGVTSARVEVSGPELPILDGSSLAFVQAMHCAGLHCIPGDRPVLRLAAPVWLTEGASTMLALPADRPRVTVAVDYPHALIGAQVADQMVDAETFARELAPARTFGFEHEVAELVQRGLALGGSLENALIFMNDGTATPMRFADEPARHKALDVIGDLSLVGALPLAHIIAVRPSHRLNVAFARRLTISDQGEAGLRHATDIPHEGDST